MGCGWVVGGIGELEGGGHFVVRRMEGRMGGLRLNCLVFVVVLVVGLAVLALLALQW